MNCNFSLECTGLPVLCYKAACRLVDRHSRVKAHGLGRVLEEGIPAAGQEIVHN